MTIKSRLLLMAGVAILGLIAVFGTGKTGIDSCQVNFDTVVDNRLPKIISLEKLIINSVRIQRDVRDMVLIKDAGRRADIEKRIIDQRAENAKLYESLEQTVKSDRGRALLAATQAARKVNSDNNNQIIALIKNGKNEEALSLITSLESENKSQSLRNAMQALIDFQKEVTALSAQEGKAASASANNWMLIISVLATGILVGIALMVINAVSGAIKDIVSSVGLVASSMRFGSRLPARQDELNDVSHSMNNLLAALEQGLAEANKVVGSIAQADFSQRMNGNYVGDLDALKQGVNGSANSVSFMMGELEKVMQGLNAGKFDVRMDQKVPQAFRNLVETALNNISVVLADIKMVMSSMNDGCFNQRVHAEARGDLNDMKMSVNSSMDRLAMAVNGITAIVVAQSHGDLTQECKANFKGQLHELQDAINASSRKLKDIVTQAVRASNTVNDAAYQVSQGSEDLSGRVQEQAAALQQTSATMTEMTSAVQTNTANARRVADLANQVKHQSTEGADVMQQTIHAMQSIQESSHKINDIVTLIDGIAFQTNLLALNAAVEAARAGEHGRGFAVVAGEVRALAQKSADAAKDIKNLITDSVHRIETGTQLADKSGEVLNGITGSIEQVAAMIEEIADASHEQSIGISQVHLAMNDIDRVTQENAALVEETTSAAESLSAEANHLKENMGFFNTGIVIQSSYQPSVSKAKPSSAKKAPMGLPSPKKGNDSGEWNNF